MATKRKSENVDGNKKAKLRKYHESYLFFGFIPSVLDSDKAECLFCGLILSNDSMKPAKLKIHKNIKHPGTIEKEDIFFVDKKKEYLSTRQVTLHNIVSTQEGILKQACRLSYEVSLIGTKCIASYYGREIFETGM